MDKTLIACAACARHVRVSEASCPFCGGVIAVSPTTGAVAPGKRLGRAALFVLGASLAGAVVAGSGCGDDDSPGTVDAGTDAGLAAPYGAPPVTGGGTLV